MGELVQYAPALAAGFLKNLQLAGLCAVFSLMAGTVLVTMRVAPIPVLRAVGTVYVTVLRNTPLTLVLAFSAVGLSDTLGLTFSSTPRTNSFWLVVLGLSVDDADAQTVRRYADRLGVKFRLAMADERVLDLYGPIRSIPTTFFINRRGEVTRRVVGYVDSETLESYVRELF